MAQGKQALKSRIKSTGATIKITSAMKLMANAKLAKQKTQMQKNREYSSILIDTLHQILARVDSNENIYLKNNSSNKELYIIFSSDLGLCGGYNTNMLRHILPTLDADDLIMVIGSKGRKWLDARNFEVMNDYLNSDDFSYNDATNIINEALKLYLNGEIGKINVVYTEFVNTVVFNPVVSLLLPVEKKDVVKMNKEILFEPSCDEILNTLIPMALKSALYSNWLETKTSEQASRRVAMENATDNANELKDKLVLQFNQARQAAITQELTEIVAGADSI